MNANSHRYGTYAVRRLTKYTVPQGSQKNLMFLYVLYHRYVFCMRMGFLFASKICYRWLERWAETLARTWRPWGMPHYRLSSCCPSLCMGEAGPLWPKSSSVSPSRYWNKIFKAVCILKNTGSLLRGSGGGGGGMKKVGKCVKRERGKMGKQKG
jgi:hypothetical protein